MQTTIAVDLAKNVFEIAVSRHPGRIAERKRLSRARLPVFFAELKPDYERLSNGWRGDHARTSRVGAAR